MCTLFFFAYMDWDKMSFTSSWKPDATHTRVHNGYGLMCKLFVPCITLAIHAIYQMKTNEEKNWETYKHDFGCWVCCRAFPVWSNQKACLRLCVIVRSSANKTSISALFCTPRNLQIFNAYGIRKDLQCMATSHGKALCAIISILMHRKVHTVFALFWNFRSWYFQTKNLRIILLLSPGHTTPSKHISKRDAETRRIQSARALFISFFLSASLKCLAGALLLRHIFWMKLCCDWLALAMTSLHSWKMLQICMNKKNGT